MSLNHEGVVAADLKVSRYLWVFAVLAVVLLVLLAYAPVRSHFPQWRAHQERYNAIARASGASEMEIRPYQVFHADAGVVDRCMSCHIGMGAAAPLAADRLFAEHPSTPHEPARFGCTGCHGGQGRATTAQAAHGAVRFWDEPMLPRGFEQAGCGSCHTHFYTPSVVLGLLGERRFRQYDCTACHRVSGVGRGTGPDLSGAGIKGFDGDWHARHLELAKWEDWPKGSYGPIPESDVAAITEYLRGRIAAPRLERGKALFFANGCIGCHKVHGVGGDDGPDLTREGLKSPWDLDFSGVRGPHTAAQWQVEHLEEPGRVVAGSRMPRPTLSPDEVQDLAIYLLSLRERARPLDWTPQDRLRGSRLGAREFASDGASLFAAFCTGCHGARGEGRQFANRDTIFPAIGNPDFLAIASDEYLKKTIASGRPGRPMPAFKGLGLDDRDIAAIVDHLRSLVREETERVASSLPKIESLPPGDAARGGALYSRHCAGCHGPNATDGRAPALRNPSFLQAADDLYIARTILTGRTGTAMRHFGRPAPEFPVLDEQEVWDIVAFLRQAPASPGERR